MKLSHRLQKVLESFWVIFSNSSGVSRFDDSCGLGREWVGESAFKILSSLKVHCKESGRLVDKAFVKFNRFCSSPLASSVKLVSVWSICVSSSKVWAVWVSILQRKFLIFSKFCKFWISKKSSASSKLKAFVREICDFL